MSRFLSIGHFHLLSHSVAAAASIGQGGAQNNVVEALVPVPHRRPSSGDDRRLLIFFPVGNSEEVMKVVSDDIEHARAQIDGVHVYLAHYKAGGARLWQDKLRPDWYKSNVDFSAERPGFKFGLMRLLLTQPNFHLSMYKWVWALDDDIDITPVLLPRLLAVAETTHALIVSPAFTQLGQSDEERALIYPHQGPDERCLYRYTRLVEVIMPVIESTALEAILSSCEHCVHNKSSWGLDRMWCSWTAEQLSRPVLQNCAIVDATVAVHKNYRSLAGKYSASRAITNSFLQTGMQDFNDTMAHHPFQFVDGPLQSQTWCEPKASMPSIWAFVLSRRDAFQTRALLRGLWREARESRVGLSMSFTLCGGADEHALVVARESRRFGDVLVLECVEGYDAGHLTRKVLLAMRHFVSTSAEFFMKVDDDTFVAWSRLATFLTRFGNERLYLGRIDRTDKPIRDPCHQFYEPTTTFPDSRYPRGMMGGTGYVLGRALVEGFLRTDIPATNMLHNEDRAVAVWVKKLSARAVGGVQADLVEVPAMDNWEPAARSAAPSWTTWGKYPYFLHHHLRADTVACLFLAEQTQDGEVSIEPCFARERPPGEDHAQFACRPQIGEPIPAGAVIMDDGVGDELAGTKPEPEPLPSSHVVGSANMGACVRTLAAVATLACVSLVFKTAARAEPQPQNGGGGSGARCCRWDAVKAMCIVLVVWEQLAGHGFNIWARSASGWPTPQLLGVIQRSHTPAFCFVSGMFSTSHVLPSAERDSLILASRHVDALLDLLLPQFTTLPMAFFFWSLGATLLAELRFPETLTDIVEFSLWTSGNWYLWALLTWRLLIPVLCRLPWPMLPVGLISLLFTPDSSLEILSRIVFYFPFFVLGFLLGGGGLEESSQKFRRQQIQDGLCSPFARVSVAIGCVVAIAASLCPGTEDLFKPTKIQAMSGGLGGCCRWLLDCSARGWGAFAIMVVCFALPPVQQLSKMGARTLYPYVFHRLLVSNKWLMAAVVAVTEGLSTAGFVLALLPLAFGIVALLCSDFSAHAAHWVLKPQSLLDLFALPSRPALSSRFALKRQCLSAVGVVGLYMIAGPALMVLNKEILRAFPYPVLVSSIGVVVSTSVSLAQLRVGKLQLEHSALVTSRFWLLRVAPVGVCQALSLVLATSQYMFSGLAMVQVMKSFTPVTVALVSWCMLHRVPSRVALAALLTLCLSTWMAAGNGGRDGLSTMGFLLALASSLAEAARLTIMDYLLSTTKMSVYESLYWLGPPAMISMLFVSLVFEFPQIAANGHLPNLVHAPHVALAAGGLGCVVNFLTAFAISVTGATSVKVFSQMRNLIPVLCGVMLYNEVMSLLQVVGYIVSMAAFGVYTWELSRSPFREDLTDSRSVIIPVQGNSYSQLKIDDNEVSDMEIAREDMALDVCLEEGSQKVEQESLVQ
eukprot:TRINITY_DN13661_c0_g1_i1.p1 TRINITY_DN13661_c0_g1~~TRINITY_DN13661_c0_g1_i1.p1  ORF type:complete len:1425 (-),score=205.83 TRINITY_DN13661_c0_g1_i1:62-4336(-)